MGKVKEIYEHWARRNFPTGGWGFYWPQYFYNEKKRYNEPPKITENFKDTSKLHFPEGARIRRPETYKITSSAELMEVQEKLAARGLKSPWLRNEVWRYERAMWGTPADRTFFLFSSLKYGVVLFGIHWFFKEIVWGPSPGHHHHHYYEDYRKAPGVKNDPYRLVNEPVYSHEELHHH